MSDEGFKYQASFKFGPGQAHMLNVRADNHQEFFGALLEAEKAVQGLNDVMAALSAAPATSPANSAPAAVAHLAAPPAPEQVVQQVFPGAQQVAPDFVQQAYAPPLVPAVAAAPAPTCVHGPRQLRTSKPGAAKTWSAWMCPTAKGTVGQCEPIWNR